MFGDVAVTFNPKDERFNNLDRTNILIPIINKEIPLLKDHRIHITFGTGLVKITPTHNKTNWAIGRDHKLPIVRVINEKCKIFNTNTKYDDMNRYKCRKELVKELTELNLIEDIKSHHNTLDVCYKCQTHIKKMDPLLDLPKHHIEKKEIQLIPEYNTKLFTDWTSKDIDWCISSNATNLIFF